MDLQEQIRLHKQISKQIEQLEEQKKTLGTEILQKMENKILKIPGFTVRSLSKLSIKLSIEAARSLNAIKIEETIDRDKIKSLYNEGIAIEGVSESRYITITEVAL